MQEYRGWGRAYLADNGQCNTDERRWELEREQISEELICTAGYGPGINHIEKDM